MQRSSKHTRNILYDGFVTITAFLALGADWVYKIFILPRPYWIFRYDPETIYFYGGLALLNGNLPSNVDNPGVPLHLLSAILLYVGGYGPLEIDMFRVFGYIIAFLLYIVIGFFLLRTVLSNLPSLIRIAGLWTYFLCSQSLEYNNIWSPEMFYFPTASLLLIAMWGGDWNGISRRRTFAIGLMLGICCSLKFTFLAFIPAFVLSLLLTPYLNHSNKLQLSGIGLSGIILGFISLTLIISPLYIDMLSRLWSFASHKGEYGQGAIGLPDVVTILTNFRTAIFSSKGWHVWLVGIFTLMGFGAYNFKKSRKNLPYRLTFITLFSIIALITIYALAIRSFNMPLRYLLPSGIIGLLLFASSLNIVPSGWHKKLQIPIIILASALLYKHITVDIDSHKKRVHEGYEMREQIENTLKKVADKNEETTIIYSWRVPDPSFALRLLANEKQLCTIETQYSQQGHYNHWQKKIYLPASSSYWNYLVIRDSFIADFPEKLGPALASIGEYHLFENIMSKID